MREGGGPAFDGQLQKRSGAARRRQRMDRAPRAVRAPAAAFDCPPAAPGRGGFTPDSRGAARWRRARSLVHISAGGRRGLAARKWAAQKLLDHRRPGGAAHLVLKCAPGAAKKRLRRLAGARKIGADVAPHPGRRAEPGCRTLSRISAHRPDWLAAAWTACIAVGAEDFPPRPLGVHGTCPHFSPGQRDVSGVPGARPRRRPASMAHKMGHRKRLPKTMRLQPQK